jgi:hypothetical protein
MRLALALGILISMAAIPGAAAADGFDFRHLRVFALGAFGNYTACSFQPEVKCEQWVFLVFQEPRVYEGGSGIAKPHTQWTVFLEHATFVFHAGQEEPEVLTDAFGVTADVDVSVDAQHLTFLHAVSDVPMDDGTSISLDLTWTAASERFVFGNDGPLNAVEGLTRFTKTDCGAEINNAHQKFVYANYSGTIDGLAATNSPFDPPDYTEIANGHFVYLRNGSPSCVGG